MTEAEWLSAHDPRPMLDFLDGKAFDRKLRLFAVWCWERDESRLSDPLRKFLATFRDRLDGTVSDADWFEAYSAIESGASLTYYLLSPDPLAAARRSSGVTRPFGNIGGRPFTVDDATRPMCDVLRDLIGNPFRPVALDPAWRTSTVLALAAGIHAEGAFDRLPILTDAVQDAGCDNEDMLTHCHNPHAVHVRGCWVVDLLLGKG
jgi:hypothetical protein